MTSTLLSVVFGYLFGSIPTGYLIVKYRSRIDITQAGSGNVGALNAGVVTGSKATGILVGVLDGLKGLAVVLGASWLTEGHLPLAAALLGAVVGHNYPVWLRFRGGRGLATACGGLFAIGLAYTAVWCLTWLALKLTGRSVLAANILATILAPPALFLVPDSLISVVMISPTEPGFFRWLALVLSAVLMISHMDGMKELIPKKRLTNA